MPDVVITEFMDRAAVARLERGYDTRYDPGLVDDPSALTGLLADCRALIVRNRTRVTDDILDAGSRLLVVGRLGVGLDNIDLTAAGTRGIAVVPARGANDDSVAEYVIATAMMLLRGAYAASGEVAAGAWPRTRLVGREFAGRTLGLVGCGAIARATARRARALGVSVAGHDPCLGADDPVWTEIERVADLTALLSCADAVSLHVPLTETTRHLIDRDAIGSMKPDAVLINAARGGVVDEEALISALKDGRLGGAALDVFESEPVSAAAGARFRDCANLILTPHIAGVTRESDARVGGVIADAVIRYLEEG